MRTIRATCLLLATLACGGGITSPPKGPTPSTLVGSYSLRSYNGSSVPEAGGPQSGVLTLRADSSYTLVVTNYDGSTIAGLGPGTWRYEGYSASQDNVSLQPSATNAPRWFGAIANGGLVFAGNGYPGLFLTQ